MTRPSSRRLVGFTATFAVAALAAGCGRSETRMPHFTPPGVSAHAMQVYDDAIVIDTHNDMPSRMMDGYDADVRHEPGWGRDRGETDLPRLVESGITAQFFAAYVDARYAQTRPDESWARAEAEMDTIHAFVNRHPDRLIPGTTSRDVLRAKREGKVAVFAAHFVGKLQQRGNVVVQDDD